MQDSEIQDMFLGLELTPLELDINLPPGYSPNNGWFGPTGSVIDLLYKCIMGKRENQKDEKNDP